MTMLALTNFPLHGWGWAWVAGPILLGMVLFWGAIIFGVVWFARERGQHRGPGPRETALTVLDRFRESVQRRGPGPQEAALTVLDRRFAEGALSPDDYQQRRSVLTGAGEPCTDQDITAESERS